MYEALVFLGIIGSLYYAYTKIMSYSVKDSSEEYIWLGKGPAPAMYENEEDEELVEDFADFPPEDEEKESEEESFDVDYFVDEDDEEE